MEPQLDDALIERLGSVIYDAMSAERPDRVVFKQARSEALAVGQALLTAAVRWANPTELNETALMQAAFHGHVDEVLQLIADGALVNHQSTTGHYALYYACQNGHDRVIRELLKAQADSNLQLNAASGAAGDSALHIACYNNHRSAVVQLLHVGTDTHLTDWKGRTALHIACQYGHFDIIEQILAVDADHQQEDKQGHTPRDLCEDQQKFDRLLAAAQEQPIVPFASVTTGTLSPILSPLAFSPSPTRAAAAAAAATAAAPVALDAFDLLSRQYDELQRKLIIAERDKQIADERLRQLEQERERERHDAQQRQRHADRDRVEAEQKKLQAELRAQAALSLADSERERADAAEKRLASLQLELAHLKQLVKSQTR